MDGIDIGLYDFDRHNAIYFFIVNADEQIYLRYGGRDAEGPLSYLDLDSLVLALERGLELHERYRRGELAPLPKPEPLFPRHIHSLYEKEIKRGRCVECHLIGDYQAQDRERSGELDKLSEMYRSPDIRTLGIELDVPNGLRLAKAEGPADDAGLQAGDTITGFAGHSVLTFADLQYRFDKLPRNSESVAVQAVREGAAEPTQLVIDLPEEWWWTETFFRFWSIEPQLHFAADRLTDAEKETLDLHPETFACRVRFVEPKAAALGFHDLKQGDIILAVEGQDRDAATTRCDVHLKLRHRAGSTVNLEILRADERIELALRSDRQFFRKQSGPR